MLRPCEPVLLALSGREGLRNPLLDNPEVLTLGLLPYTHLYAHNAAYASQASLQYNMQQKLST